MRQDGSNDPFRVTFRTEDLAAAKRVIVEARPAFVVEIVQERDDTPIVFVLASEPRVATNRGFNGERVLQQSFAFGLPEQQLQAFSRFRARFQ